MKRLLALIFLLGFSLCALSSAQLEPLPDDPRFDQPVEFRTSAAGESLSTMIYALAKSVGLTAVVEDVPEQTTTYNIGDPKPFRQVWDIVLTLNDLDYLLLPNDLVVVGTPESVAKLKDQPVEGDGGTIIQEFYRVSNDPESLAAVLRQAVPGISVEVLPDLSTLSVRASEPQHTAVSDLLARFDTEVASAVRRVYYLSNADAEELAATLEATLVSTTSTPVTDAEPRNADSSESEAAGDSAAIDNAAIASATVVQAGDISIAPDSRTNSLIVTAPEVVQTEIARLIEQLDIPQPQVNVQVRIQEIQKRTAANMGIDLTAGIGNFAATFLSEGLNFVFDAQRAVSGLNIGAVLDTLEEQDLSRQVDDATLTMLNNSTGRMQAGGRIEITFGSADGEIQQRTIEYGVIIEVTPRISSDGRVILEVSAEVSDLAIPLSSSAGIPQRIDFVTREVTSTVTLEPGQTVLLGGLLQNSFSTTTDRVPLLGSLPIIGNLFTQTTQSEESTELLLIVTADVIE